MSTDNLVLTDETFLAILKLCAGHWPESSAQRILIGKWLNSEAKKRGYENWSHAYEALREDPRPRCHWVSPYGEEECCAPAAWSAAPKISSVDMGKEMRLILACQKHLSQLMRAVDVGRWVVQRIEG